jgi:hypothetical protein
LILGVLTEVALTVTVPLVIALNSPVELIEAVPVPGITLHTTDLSAALAGKTRADICKVPWNVEIATADPAPETAIELTRISWFEIVMTISPKISVLLAEVARTVTVPSVRALRRPDELMEAVPDPFMTLQITVLSSALKGKTRADI